MTGADKNVPSVAPVSGSTLHACVVTGGQDDRSASGWIVAGHVTACVANDAQSALAAARRIPAARVPVVPVDGRAHPHEAHYAWPLRADAFAACTALAWIDGDILTLVSPVNDRADRAKLAAQVGFPADRITWQTSEVTNDPALALRAAIAAVTLAQACGRPVQVDGIIDHDTHAHFTLSASFDRTGALQEWDTMASATHAVADAESAPVIYTAAHAVSRSADPSHAIPPQAHVFARESFIDEIAGDTTRDPVALRLTHLADHSARELIRSVAQRAAWHGGTRDRKTSAKRSGRGFAFDRSVDPAPAYTAWIVDLEVDRRTGEVSVNRVVAGRGTGSLVKGVPARQIADAVARTLGLRIRAEPSHDETPGDQPLSHAVTAAATSAAMPQPDAAALLDASTHPAAAAIANALFDATGVRFRAPPFTPERVREALAQAAAPGHKRTPAAWFSASRLRGGIAGRTRGRHDCSGHRGGVIAAVQIAHSADPEAIGIHLVRSHDRTRPPARGGGRLRGVPYRYRRRDERGRPRSRHTFRHSLFDQPHAGRSHRHRRVVVHRVRPRDASGHFARWPASLSRVPVHGVHEDERRRHDRALCVPDVATGRRVVAAANAPALPAEPAPGDGRVERALS